MAKQKPLVPTSVLKPAIEQVYKEFPDVREDYWGEKHTVRCRELCGEGYRNIESDWFRRRAIALRKDGKLSDIKKKGAKRKKYREPEGWYAEYLRNEHWRLFRMKVLEFWDYSCALCLSRKNLEVHHRTYLRLWEENLSDCICLCQRCHRKNHGQMADDTGHEELF